MFISTFQIKQGASLPWLEVQITPDGMMSSVSSATDACGNASTGKGVDLSNLASVTFQVVKCGRNPSPVALSGLTEVVDAVNGLVRYKWHPLDTQTPGLYYGTFVLTFSDNSVYKWPVQLEALSIEVEQ